MFLLIQGDVIDRHELAAAMQFSQLDDSKPFTVAIGTVNEFKKPEIVGIVARYDPTPDQTIWRLSSEIDGYSRMVGIGSRPGEVIRTRLRVLQGNDRYEDLCQLPQEILLRGEA